MPQSAPPATTKTMRWPRPSSACSKTEVIHHRGPWRELDAVEYATLEWVDWFKNRRLLKPIGNVPSAERERTYYRQLEESIEAA